MKQKQISRRQFIAKWVSIGFLIALLIGGAVVVYGFFVYGWKWTGFSGQLLFNWLDILLVPAVVGAGAVWFTVEAQRELEGQRDEQRRHERSREREVDDQRAQDTALHTYLKHMGDLLLDKDLLNHHKDAPVSKLARAWTVTVLETLGPQRKRSLMRFLYESRLIDTDQPIIPLQRARLIKAYLANSLLVGANLEGAWLREADLNGTNLKNSNLRCADLTNADLSNTDLSNAELRDAELRDADLSGANLAGVRGVANEELEQQAKSLKGAIMPDGSKYD